MCGWAVCHAMAMTEAASVAPMAGSASWADVALAAMAFMREEPVLFFAVLFGLFVVIVAFLAVLYRMLPGTVRQLSRLLSEMRTAGKRFRMNGDDDSP